MEYDGGGEGFGEGGAEIEPNAAWREGPGGEAPHDQLDRRADVLQVARHVERQLGFGLTSPRPPADVEV